MKLRLGRWTIGLSAAFWCALALAAVVAGAVKYSESPAFCRSCHIMEPYYQAWKSSKHGHIACVECHYPPASAVAPQTLLWKKFQALSQVAKYVTKTYSSKPFAEVADASCLQSGCHSKSLLDGKVQTKKKLRFDHRPHFTKAGPGGPLGCTSCHSQVMVGSHIEVNNGTCFLCHFKGRGEGRELKPLAGCTGCHELPKQDFKIGAMTYNHKGFVGRGVSCQSCHLNSVQGKGQASKDRCLNCHNVLQTLERYEDTDFLHEQHVTKKNLACSHCHDDIKHGFGEAPSALPRLNEPARPQPKSAGAPASHPPTLTFDCALCHTDKHSGQLELYSGQAAALGLPAIPSPMFAAHVDCSGCHYEKKNGGRSAAGVAQVTFRASHEACVKCHGPRYEGMWQAVHDELSKTIGALDANMEQVSSGLKALAPEPRKGAQKELDAARRLVAFIKDSRGEHNVYLASVALRRAQEKTDGAASASKTKVADLSEHPLISGNYCAVLCHEKAGVKVPRETVRYRGKELPHAMHAGLVSCGQCHEVGGHRQAPLKKDIDALCESCHPQ